MPETAATRRGPHEFRALRLWDNRKRGRCSYCHLPRFAHPVHAWPLARPYGDRSPASMREVRTWDREGTWLLSPATHPEATDG